MYLTRNEAGIYIDGVYFEIEKLGKGEKQSLPQKNNIQTNRNYHQEIEGLADIIRKREEEIAGNILVSPSDKKVMESNVKTLFRELAYMREDLQKLEG